MTRNSQKGTEILKSALDVMDPRTTVSGDTRGRTIARELVREPHRRRQAARATGLGPMGEGSASTRGAE